MKHVKDTILGSELEVNDESTWCGERVFVINFKQIEQMIQKDGKGNYDIFEFKTKDEYRTFAQHTLRTSKTNLIKLSEMLYEKYKLCAWDGIEKLAGLRNSWLEDPKTWCLVETLENKYGKEIGYCTELYDKRGHRVIITHEELLKDVGRLTNGISKYYPSIKVTIN